MTDKTTNRALTPSEQTIVEKVSREFVNKAKAALEPLRREMKVMRVDPALAALQWGIVAGVATAYGEAETNATNRLVDLLRLIADNRGQCEVCGADCEGSGEGVCPDPCPRGHEGHGRPCSWGPGNQMERAKEALKYV
jgi:rubrerythrin